MKKAKEIKETIITFGDSTSMHGVSNVIKSDSTPGRVMWSVVCLAALAMFLFMLTSLVLQYLSFPVNVQISQVRTKSYRVGLS